MATWWAVGLWVAFLGAAPVPPVNPQGNYSSYGLRFNNIYAASADTHFHSIMNDFQRSQFLKSMGAKKTVATSTPPPRKPVSGKYRAVAGSKPLDNLISQVTKDTAQQKALKDVFLKVRREIDEGLRKKGREDDLFSSLSLMFVFSYSVYADKEVSEKGIEAVYQQVRASLQSDAMAKLSDETKQEIADSMMYIGLYPVVTLGLYGEKMTLEQRKQLQGVAGSAIKWALGLDPATIVIDDKGMHTKG